MPYVRSAGAVVFYKRGKIIEYLLLEYKGKYWDFPRGHVEKGESDQGAAKREIREETGLKKIQFIPNFHAKTSWYYREKSDKRLTYKEVLYYACRSKTKKIKVSFEHNRAAWVTYAQAMKKASFKNMKDLLRKAHIFIIHHYR